MRYALLLVALFQSNEGIVLSGNKQRGGESHGAGERQDCHILRPVEPDVAMQKRQVPRRRLESDDPAAFPHDSGAEEGVEADVRADVEEHLASV